MQSLFDRFRHPEDVHAFDDFRAIRAVNARNRTGSVAWFEVEDDEGGLHTVPIYFFADIPSVMAAANDVGTILKCFRPGPLAVDDEPALIGLLLLRDGTTVGTGETTTAVQPTQRLH